jgi:hypothetical protein
MRRLWPGLLLVLLGCEEKKVGPVCGLHSASAPVSLEQEKRPARQLGVGARLAGGDPIKADGWALVECFGGALAVLHKDSVTVNDLKAAHIEATNIPRKKLDGTSLAELQAMRRTVEARYTDNRFTPESALNNGKDFTTGQYMVAFFTPNGLEKLASIPVAEGPRGLPPPPNRPKVPHIHAADLGEGGPLLEVTDDVVFAETDDLATAALLEDHTYGLGRTVRLVLPDGAEAKLKLPNGTVKLEGPLDLTLR